MSIVVRPLREDELDSADLTSRLAFGTFLGLADPAGFRGDSGLIHTRWKADPEAAFGAELDGLLVGSIFAMDWGRVGIVGPVSVHPDYWSRGIARAMMPAVLDLFDRRGMTLAGLFTHPHSTLHIRLYESFCFWTNHITAIMARAAPAGAAAAPPEGQVAFSALDAAARKDALEACRAVADGIYPGLDLGREVDAVARMGLGETVLAGDRPGADGFAVCHSGPGSEGGSATLLVKFAAVRGGPGAADRLAHLLDGCEALAARRRVATVVAGVNTGRRDAYRLMKARGYRAMMNGVAMHRPDGKGYNLPEVFALDDWR